MVVVAAWGGLVEAPLAAEAVQGASRTHRRAWALLLAELLVEPSVVGFWQLRLFVEADLLVEPSVVAGLVVGA